MVWPFEAKIYAIKNPEVAVILEKSVEHSNIPFVLISSKANVILAYSPWESVWKPLMLRLALHERHPHDPTDFFRVIIKK